MIGPEYLTEIFKIVPSPCLVLSPVAPDFNIVAVNDAFLLLTKLSGSQLIGQALTTVFTHQPGIFIEAWEDAFQNIVKNKTQITLAAQKKSGLAKKGIAAKPKPLDVTISPVLNKQGEIAYLMLSFRDVSAGENKRRQEDAALQRILKNEQLLNEVQHISKIGAFEIDLCNNKLTWSTVQREIHEVDPDYEPGITDVVTFYKQNRERAMITTLAEDAAATNQMFDVELAMTTAKGNERLVRSIGKAVYKDNRCVRLYGITQDITDHKTVVQIHNDSRNKFQSLLKGIGVVVWESCAETFELSFISEHIKSILGYSPEQWLSKKFWENQIHPDDREYVLNYCKSETKKGKNYSIDYRLIRADGRQVWVKDIVTVVIENGRPQMLQGVMVDISETRRLNEVEFLEKKILELNGMREMTTQDVLKAYLEGIELLYPKMQCAILQVKNNKLYKWAAPSLPGLYMTAIEGLPVSKSVGSSGAAAFLKHEIVITDIKTDPRWAKHRKVALKANIKACWSYPIMAANNEVMATFGLYHKEPKAPDNEEQKFIDRTLAVLKRILENRRTLEQLEEAQNLMTNCQEIANLGVWSWDLVSNKVTWSDSLFEIYGLNKLSYRPSFEAYLSLLHPEDQERVSVNMGGVLSTKKDVRFEERILRPSGEIRYLKSSARIILDGNGNPQKLIGATIDVSESKKQKKELQAGETRFKRIVQSQPTYIIRVDFQGKFTFCNDKFVESYAWKYGQQNLIGLDSIQILSPQQYQELFNLAENCINQPETFFEAEVEGVSESGDPRVVLWQFVCLTDDKGLPFEMQATGIDFTKYAQARETLKFNHERYKYMNLINNEAIYDLDVLSGHINWGDGYYKLFGYEKSDDDFSLNEWLSNVHPDEASTVDAHLQAILDDPAMQSWNFNYQFKKADGTYAYIEDRCYIIRDEQGKALKLVGTMRDVSVQKKTDAELKALQKELEQHLKILTVPNGELSDGGKDYKDLFYMSPQPMWIFEAATLKFLEVNDAAIKFYGYSREEFLLMDGTMIVPKAEISKGQDESNQLMIKKEIVFHGVYQHVKKDGTIMHMDIQSKKIKFQEKDTYLVLANDITERIKYMENVEKQNQKLQEISWMQSHVVRTPVARIVDLMDSIEARPSLSVDKTQLDNFLSETADKLESLISKMTGKA